MIDFYAQFGRPLTFNAKSKNVPLAYNEFIQRKIAESRRRRRNKAKNK